ncbi:unnamed protein product [Rhodiola kirilowii]
MGSVVLMLSNDSTLPPPKVPGFFTSSESAEPDSCSNNHQLYSANKMSVTVMEPR